jgi:transposase InsO family protein
VEAHFGMFPITVMAELLELSRSGIYDYLKRSKEEISKYPTELLDEVHRIWKKNRCVYGLRKILKAFKEIDPSVGARKLRNIMNILQIKGKQDKKYTVSTTDSNHDNRIAPDLVQREFTVDTPNKVWVSDVTFLKSTFGWIYLCVILDLYSRKIVGWSVSKSNDSDLVCDTLRKAISNRNPDKGLIFHSDRGSNYTSNDTRSLLAIHKIRRSNSRKGNCWDNAVAESFFGTLKREIEYSIFNKLKEAKEYLFDYLEIFYNRQRMHSKLGYVSPVKFEEQAT